MKQLSFLFIVALLFVRCGNQDNSDLSKNGSIQIESAADNPCIKCTERLQLELAVCLKNAGTNEEKKRKCNKDAAEKWTRECKALCIPPPTNALDGETPRMKCLREAQEAHLKCLAKAKTSADSSVCNKALAQAVIACPPPSPE